MSDSDANDQIEHRRENLESLRDRGVEPFPRDYDRTHTAGEAKDAFDPDWLLNPGQVCGDVKMTENLRYGTDYEFDAGFDPELEWRNENGF